MVETTGHRSPGEQPGDGVHADGVQQRDWIPATHANDASSTWSVTHTLPPPHPSLVPRVHDGTSVHADVAQQLFPPTQAVAAGVASKMEEVVTAIWKSSGCRLRAARPTLMSTIRRMKSWKLAASPACFESIEPESSTTNRMSALEVFGSATRTDPGWRTQLPTGVNWYSLHAIRGRSRTASAERRRDMHGGRDRRRAGQHPARAGVTPGRRPDGAAPASAPRGGAPRPGEDVARTKDTGAARGAGATVTAPAHA